MISEICAEIERRGITRLCHFAPSRNLLHIMAGGEGILSTAKLKDEDRSIYNPTDLLRLDQHPEYICCSIEYPNVWYFDKARTKERIFKDWVVIMINPLYLAKEGTKFCRVNAATASGYYIEEGFNGFQKLFTTNPGGSRQVRGVTHLPCCTTDDQAEVLVYDSIRIEDIIGIGVANENQAKNELLRMKLCKIDNKSNIIIAPHFYQKRVLSSEIRKGNRLPETKYEE